MRKNTRNMEKFQENKTNSNNNDKFSYHKEKILRKQKNIKKFEGN